MELKRNNKGITLIALVVTIIVLLILAGVSIATLTGNNGILTRTKDAKETNEYKAAEEKVKLSVMGAKSKDNGELKVSTLRTEVEESYSGTISGTEFPVQVTIDEKTFSVDGDGNVTSGNKKSLEELKKIIEAEKNDCMIDEEGNIIPINAWDYEIIDREEKKDICRIASYSSNDYGQEYYNAYNGNILEDGTLQYNIPTFIKEDNKIFKVTELAERALKEQKNLKSIYIPNNIEYIGQYAFSSCGELESVKMAQNVKEIIYGAFIGCANLKNINLSPNLIEISTETFTGCQNLENITIPASVTKINYAAFLRCDKLKSVVFENKEGWSTARYITETISIDVNDPATNAKNLIDTYESYVWNRT